VRAADGHERSRRHCAAQTSRSPDDRMAARENSRHPSRHAARVLAGLCSSKECVSSPRQRPGLQVGPIPSTTRTRQRLRRQTESRAWSA
jgi:hypothetical protein